MPATPRGAPPQNTHPHRIRRAWTTDHTRRTGANSHHRPDPTAEGTSPFTSSGHPGRFNTVFCDGSVKFLSANIDGTVYSTITTPTGSKLPVWCTQYPVYQDAITN